MSDVHNVAGLVRRMLCSAEPAARCCPRTNQMLPLKVPRQSKCSRPPQSRFRPPTRISLHPTLLRRPLAVTHRLLALMHRRQVVTRRRPVDTRLRLAVIRRPRALILR